jgi:hypothetical protein
MHPLTATLLDPASDAESPGCASAELHALFRAAADAAEAITDRRFDSGLALSPVLAARCLLDGRRTRAFLRGASSPAVSGGVPPPARSAGETPAQTAGEDAGGPLDRVARPDASRQSGTG